MQRWPRRDEDASFQAWTLAATRCRETAKRRRCGRVRGFVAPTDHGCYPFLLARPELDEVNSWYEAEVFGAR